MRFMWDFREAMWGVVQQGISELDFDFAVRRARTSTVCAPPPPTPRSERRSGARDRARVVVIGGGVGGCSIAYWLTKLGERDVVLVERADLTSGSTFHSAGLVGQLRALEPDEDDDELGRPLPLVEAEVGLETGWREVGSLRPASSQERMEELSRQAGWAKTFSLPLDLISSDEARELFPPISTEGVLGAAFLPADGYIDPSQLTFALAEGARRGGAEINTSTRVTGIDVERERVTGVQTDKGSIEADVVVNAGGCSRRSSASSPASMSRSSRWRTSTS